MPIHLARFDDYTKLPGLAYGLSWICFACLCVNRPSSLDCAGCDKPRWSHLGLSYADAKALAKEIR